VSRTVGALVASGRETWILVGFVVLAVAGLAVAAAGAILLVRRRGPRRAD
jgi:hypothetical protein